MTLTQHFPRQATTTQAEDFGPLFALPAAASNNQEEDWELAAREAEAYFEARYDRRMMLDSTI